MKDAVAPEFRQDRPAQFPSGALGEAQDGENQDVELRETRLPNGCRLLLARPSGGAVLRSVVLAPSARGFTAMFTELCLRLAQRHRWAVSAPDPLPGEPCMELRARESRLAQVGDDSVIDDLICAADHLTDGPTALIGFCLGGLYAYEASDRGRFDRVVSFYGMLTHPVGWTSQGQGDPRRSLAGRRCPVLSIFGAQDELISAADRCSLEEMGVEQIIYPHAGHAFAHDPSLPGYRVADATDAWRQTVTFLLADGSQSSVLAPNLGKE